MTREKRGRTMRKFLTRTLALLVVMTALAGCKKDTETTAPEETTAENNAGTYDPDFTGILDDYGYLKGMTAAECVEGLDFADIQISKSYAERISDSYADYVVKEIQTKLADEVTDRAIIAGDLVNINYSGSVDGVKFDGGTAENHEVTAGSNEFIDDFLTQIIGHETGDEFDVEVTFPDPYTNADLAGKDAVFAVKINSIKEAFTDEFVEKKQSEITELTGVFGLNTVEDVRKHFYDNYYDYYVRNEIVKAISEMDVVKNVPEAAANYAKKALDASAYTQYGMTYAELAKQSGVTDEQIEAHAYQTACGEIIFQVLYEEVGWKIDESEFQEATGLTDNTEMIAVYGKGYIARNVMYKRAQNLLKERVTYIE